MYDAELARIAGVAEKPFGTVRHCPACKRANDVACAKRAQGFVMFRDPRGSFRNARGFGNVAGLALDFIDSMPEASISGPHDAIGPDGELFAVSGADMAAQRDPLPTVRAGSHRLSG